MPPQLSFTRRLLPAAYRQCHFSPDYVRNYTVIGTEGRLENFDHGQR